MATSKGRFSFFGSKRDKKSDASTAGAVKGPPVQSQKSYSASFGEIVESVTSDPSLSYDVKFDGPLTGDVVVPPEMTTQNVVVEGASAVRISGGSPSAMSAGRTAGLSIRVPDEFEAGVSGKRVLVQVMARTAAEGSGEFYLAYSTAEVGNSSWKSMRAGAQFELHSFEWNVPTMQQGFGDYVGILPGVGAIVDVALLRVEVIPRG